MRNEANCATPDRTTPGGTQRSCTMMATRGELSSAELALRSLTHPNRRYSSTVHISKYPHFSFLIGVVFIYEVFPPPTVVCSEYPDLPLNPLSLPLPCTAFYRPSFQPFLSSFQLASTHALLHLETFHRETSSRLCSHPLHRMSRSAVVSTSKNPPQR